MENEKIFELMTKMYSEMRQVFKKVFERFEKLDEKLGSLESKVNKNTILLEKTNADVKPIVEVQQSFSEQLDRAKAKDGKTLGERLDVIELAVSNTSKKLDQSFNKLSEKIDDLQIDVNTTSSKAARTEKKVIEFERRFDERKQG